MSVKVIALAGLVSMVLFGCASSKPVIDLAANVKEDVPDHAVATVAPRGWTSVCYRCVKQLRLDEDLVYDFERDGPAKEFRRALAILQVEKGAHARVEERLERAGRLDLLAPEPALLAHDEDLERGAGLERVHEPEEARPLHEFRAADPAVVDVDAGRIDGPALARGVCLGVLDLACDALLRDRSGPVGQPPLVRPARPVSSGWSSRSNASS
jgi:hypothetical protein